MAHFFGWTLPFLVLNFLTNIFASELEYPVHIYELGDILVTQPILEFCPEGAEMISAPPYQPYYLPYSFDRYKGFRPELRMLSLDLISKYFMERGLWKLVTNQELFSQVDRQFISILKDRMNQFNPSFLDGIDDSTEEGRAKIACFGSIFFRTFKVAYPGLRNVKLSKNEIVDLVLIATGWFMDNEEEMENNKDIFLAKFLKIYHPQYSDVLPAFRAELKEIHKNGSKIVFEAVMQLQVKGIKRRNFYLLDELTASEQLYNFLDTPEVFYKLLPNISNINHANSKEFHVLFDMIKKGHFYPEAMMRPELRSFRISSYNQYFFKDFYSEALYFAFKYINVPALKFLLNLDYEMYAGPAIDKNSDSDSDVDDSSDSDSSEYLFSQSLTQESFNNLRSIFLSDTFDQVIECVPNLYEFSFCNCDIQFIIKNYKDHFPSVFRINENYIRSIEEIVAATLNHRRKRKRSQSPTNDKIIQK